MFQNKVLYISKVLFFGQPMLYNVLIHKSVVIKITDFNGNRRIDPTDIGIEIARNRIDEEKTQFDARLSDKESGQDEKQNMSGYSEIGTGGCFSAVFFAITVLITFLIIKNIQG